MVKHSESGRSVEGLGLTGIDKSKVNRICKELDELVEPFRNRRLEGEYPYLWLDTLYLKVRQNNRIVSLAVVTATEVDTEGRWHILGFAMRATEESAFWIDFLHSGGSTRPHRTLPCAVEPAPQ